MKDRTMALGPHTLPDVMMVDKAKAEMIWALGRLRSPFGAIDSWPSLADVLADCSAKARNELPQEDWAREGGTLHKGKPTCSPTSPLAVIALRNLAQASGGMLWTDSDGVLWAVRLVPDRADRIFGFCISWQGNAKPSTARRKLAGIGADMRLGRRAEQLLWAVHQAVLAQRSSVVLLPDVLLGQYVWSGDRVQWPANWRRDLFLALRCLTYLRSEVVRLGAGGWRPHLGAHSVAVAGVEQLCLTRPEEDECRLCCRLWGTGIRHSHFLVQVGLGFLGILEKFAQTGMSEPRQFNFEEQVDEDGREAIQEACESGQIITVSAPAAILGPAKWSALSPAQVRLIQALVRETTRVPHRRRGQDGTQIIRGNVVAGKTPKLRVACPLLSPSGRYVVFGGNGRRRGMGYLLVGQNAGGWLVRCGYSVSDDLRDMSRECRKFLRDLATLADLLGLTVVGLLPRTMNWLSLTDLDALVRRADPEWLSVHLRVYGPEDFHDRIQSHLARQAGFESGSIEASSGRDEADLVGQIAGAGIRQIDLAQHLGVSQPYVSQMMTGRRPWTAAAKQEVARLLARSAG